MKPFLSRIPSADGFFKGWEKVTLVSSRLASVVEPAQASLVCMGATSVAKAAIVGETPRLRDSPCRRASFAQERLQP